MKPTPRWTDETYDALENVGVLYDYVGAYATRADVAFYVKEVSSAGGRVLELASGTGRVLLPIARAGFSLECFYGNFDRSPLSDESPEIVVAARAGSW